MGICKYCNEKAGVFRSVHRKCQEEYASQMVVLMESGHFREAATTAHKVVDLDPTLSELGSYLLSHIYFIAICNAKESEAHDAPEQLKFHIRGMEEQLRLANPSLYSYLYEEPTEEELEHVTHIRACTLETLECSYAQAREMAELYTLAVLKAARPGSQHMQEARERLATIRMMDEMYGVAGDGHEPIFANASAVAYVPEESKILEEMIQLKEATPLLFTGVTDKITGSEATMLIRKKTAGVVGGGGRVFPVSDTANEADIVRWLNHPRMDSTKFLDTSIVNVAAQTPVPTKMMERILRSLFGEEYERYYGIAEERLRQGSGR